MTFLRKILNNKSVAVVWLISYMLTFMVPVILGIVIYFTVSVNYQNEVIKSNTAALKHAEITMDNVLQNIENLSIKISTNKRIKDLLHYNGVQNSQYRYSVKAVTDDLKNFILSDLYIQDMYIYLPNSDFILSTIGYMEKDLAYQIFGEPFGLTNEYWTQLLQNTDSPVYLSSESTDIDNQQTQIMQYLRPISLDNSTEKKGMLVINFNSGWFENLLTDLQNTSDDTIIMMDNNANIFCTSNNNIQNNELEQIDIYNTGNFKNIKLNNKKMAVSVLHSDITKWRYIFVTPMSSYMGQFTFLRRFLIISNVICLLIGFVFVFYFTKRNYRNIFEVVKNISSKLDIEPADNENEYGFITRAINNTIEQNQSENERFHKHNQFMKNNFLSRLLQGRISDYSFLKNALDIYGLHFPSDSFAVMIVINEQTEQEYDDGIVLNSFQNLKLMNVAIKNILEEMLGLKYFVQIIDMDDFMVALVCPNDGKSEPDLHKTASDAKAILEKQFKLPLTFGISNFYKGYVGITRAYEEALELIEYRTVMSNGNIIKNENLASVHSKYYYPAETEHHLINSIRLGDLNSATGILNEIYTKNFTEAPSGLNYRMAKLLLYEILNSVLKAINTTEYDSEPFYDDIVDLIDKVAVIKNIDSIRDSISEIIKNVCAFFQTHTKSTASLGDSVLQYIEENYMNQSLCLKMISENFKLTPNYLSKLFSEQTGERIPDYINKTRINHAKQIMQISDDSILKIAQAVGYVNSNVFIRAFKKYEGITPGIYQKHINRKNISDI